MSHDPIQDDDPVPTWTAPRLGVHPANGAAVGVGGETDGIVSSTGFS